MAKGLSMDNISEKRQAFINALFPAGVPRLWCPLLTHYRKDGTIDFDRMSAHFNHIARWVKGFLIPGSTGDGWELDDQETLKVAEFAIGQAQKHEISLLLGALKTDIETMKQTISSMLMLIGQQDMTGKKDVARLLRAKRICGFTICPAKGKALTQVEIEAGLAEILDIGMPMALYQLPQVTENEVAPETFGRLMKKYPNLVFFKDSGGQDGIATSDFDKENIFFVRGAEGDYARWLKDAGGPYEGFLLSTANCFPQELRALIENLERGEQKKALEISERLTIAIGEVFALVQPLPCGNPFTNANKSIDHFFAFGPLAAAKEGPMLHAKVSIPDHIISATGAILTRCNLMPEKGYME